LQDAGYAGGHLNSNVFATLGKQLGGHPGRRAKVCSRYAVNDLDVEFAFSGHVSILLFCARL
jgi:hypothetical protein